MGRDVVKKQKKKTELLYKPYECSRVIRRTKGSGLTTGAEEINHTCVYVRNTSYIVGKLIKN